MTIAARELLEKRFFSVEHLTKESPCFAMRKGTNVTRLKREAEMSSPSTYVWAGHHITRSRSCVNYLHWMMNRIIPWKSDSMMIPWTDVLSVHVPHHELMH